jgi:hypothetical protein
VSIPTDSKARKDLPIVRGCLDYFPDALLAVAELSRYGNDKHNPGEPLHWAKEKSTDHADCCVRHLLERGTMDYSYGADKPVRHSAAAAWRALANLQIEIEESQKKAEAAPEKVERDSDGQLVSAPFDGWIKWRGGENPEPGKSVAVRFSNGEVIKCLVSGIFYWDHRGTAGDIVAYKVVEETK